MFLCRPGFFSPDPRSPRVCGDVSMKSWTDFIATQFSPRMRGCFQVITLEKKRLGVLPAYAGMFPTSARKAPRAFCSPRVCGDVSEVKQHADLRSAFSPRMRGCFYSLKHGDKTIQVIPAQRR